MSSEGWCKMLSWSDRWRGGRRLSPVTFDALLAVALTVLIIAEGAIGSSSSDGLLGGSPAPLLMTLPLAWRRRYPLPVFYLVVAGALMAVSSVPYVGFTCVLVAAYSVGAYARRPLVSLGIVLAIATAIAVVIRGGFPPLPQWTAPFVILLPLWLAGHAIRTRQLRADLFEDRATRLEREQEEATRAALAAERGRIARELHDVVAHSVGVMVVQAGAARHVLHTSPDQAGEALRAVEASGREAMTELRLLLGVLSDDGDETPLAPQPGLAQVQALVQRVADAGLPARLHVEGQAHPLPPGIDLAAYRIVQEALTNALKYAGGAPTEVILEYRDAALKIAVLDQGDGISNGRRDEEGRGLAGMRQRVALYGGTLEAGPRLECGYAVRAWLPLEGAYT